MSATTLPRPGPAFTANARRLKALIAEGTASGRGEERTRLQSLLRAKFSEAFGLSPDRGRLAERLYYRFCNSALRPKDKIFDHLEFFRRGRNVVIVSQPYGFDEAELARWAADAGASYTIASEWAYYYPGRASLLLVEFTMQAKALFDKRLWRA